MTSNIKRLASGFSAVALMLGGVVIPTGSAFADMDLESCLASSESICTLLEDATMSGLYTLDRDLTIDLNGHNITSTTTAKFFEVKGHTLNITGSGSISTTDSTNTGIIRVYGTDSASSSDSTRVTVGENVTLAGPNAVVVYNNGGAAYNTQIDIYGTLNGQNSGIWMIGDIKNKTNYPVVNIHDGATLSASNEDGVAVSAMGYAEWNIGEATITGGGSGVGVKAGVVNIDGASVTGTTAPEALPPATYNNGIKASGAAIQIEKNSSYAGGIELSVESGRFVSEHESAIYEYGSAETVESIEITGGVFSTDPDTYLAEGYNSYNGGDGYYVFADDAFTIAFSQSEYQVVEGYDIDVAATVTPATIGQSGRSDVEYAVYYMNGDELTNSEVLVDGNTIYAREGATGSYKLVATDMNGNTAQATLRVVEHGSLSVEDKTLYVNLSGPDVQEFTFAELGVSAEGEGITAETEGEGNVYVDFEDQTVSVYDDDVVVWSYDGEERGRTTFVTYYAYDYNENYGVRAGGSYYFVGGASENVAISIADETIAELATVTETSGEDEYETTRINGLKAGSTEILYTLDNGTVVKRTPLVVYELQTTLKQAQAVGTSQTFTITPSEGYKVKEFYAASASSSISGEETDGPIEYATNNDGTYTIKVKEMPTYTVYEYDDDWNVVLDEDGNPVIEETGASPYVWVSVELEDKNGNVYYEGYGIVIFELNANDEAAEAVDDEENAAKANEKVMQGYVTDIVATLAEIYDENTTPKSVELTLPDGTKATISDVDALIEALANGETIEAVLTEPERKKELELGDAEAAKLKAEMGFGKTGYRFVDINVELRSGDKVVGKITDLKKPLTVSADVSDDKPVAVGYTRKYYVVLSHNGETKKVDNVSYDATNKIVSFESDRFSTYLIAYTDTISGDESGTPKAPNTGIAAEISASQNVVMATVAILAMVVLAGAAKFAKR